MIVFLDIPLPLANIDWIPVGFIFIFFYGLVISSEMNHRGLPPAALRRKKMAAALTGWWLLLLCMLAGGGLYYLVQDSLPRSVRNGIDSFGVRADITLPYPSGELVHLHGSVLLLLLTILGFRLLLKKTALPPLVVPVTVPSPPVRAFNTATPSSTASTSVTPPAYRRSSATVHDQYHSSDGAPDCRFTTPPPIAVILPKPAPRIGSVQPCVVDGVIEPART